MRKRNAKVVRLDCEFQAQSDHVVAVFDLNGQSTLGIRFQSPEQILEFMQRLMDKAILVWPNNPWIQEYISDDNRSITAKGKVM